MNLSAVLGGPAPVVAPMLLGMRLESVDDGCSLFIDEVEAYTADDPASHSYRGPTSRNRSMFGPPGMLYVYRSYGVHWCANVVTGPVGSGAAVLLRGGVPERRVEIMTKRRGRSDHICDGPGKLCQAMGVTGADDGSSLLSGRYRLSPGVPVTWESTARVGIRVGVDRPWRFVADGVPDVGAMQVRSHTDDT